MAKRFSLSEKWRTRWHRTLSLEAKALWMWMHDSCDWAGFLEVDHDRAAFEISVPVDRIATAWGELSEGYEESDGWIWLPDFLREQKNLPLNEKDNMYALIMGLVEEQKSRFPNVLDMLRSPRPPKPLPRGSKGACKPLARGSEGAFKPLAVVDEGASKPLPRGKGQGQGESKGKGEGVKRGSPRGGEGPAPGSPAPSVTGRPLEPEVYTRHPVLAILHDCTELRGLTLEHYLRCIADRDADMDFRAASRESVKAAVLDGDIRKPGLFVDRCFSRYETEHRQDTAGRRKLRTEREDLENDLVEYIVEAHRDGSEDAAKRVERIKADYEKKYGKTLVARAGRKARKRLKSQEVPSK